MVGKSSEEKKRLLTLRLIIFNLGISFKVLSVVFLIDSIDGRIVFTDHEFNEDFD